METILKGNGEKGDWFIILQDKVALRMKRGMKWADMMQVAKVIEENVDGVHIKNNQVSPG